MAKQDVDCVLRRSFFLSFFLSFCVGEQPTWPRLTLGIGRSLLRQIVLSLLRDKLVSLLRKSPISEWLNCHVSFAKEPCFHRGFWRKESDAVPVLHYKPCPGRIVVDRTSIIADTAAAWMFAAAWWIESDQEPNHEIEASQVALGKRRKQWLYSDSKRHKLWHTLVPQPSAKLQSALDCHFSELSFTYGIHICIYMCVYTYTSICGYKCKCIYMSVCIASPIYTLLLLVFLPPPHLSVSLLLPILAFLLLLLPQLGFGPFGWQNKARVPATCDR